jgi:hypothetical protein
MATAGVAAASDNNEVRSESPPTAVVAGGNDRAPRNGNANGGADGSTGGSESSAGGSDSSPGGPRPDDAGVNDVPGVGPGTGGTPVTGNGSGGAGTPPAPAEVPAAAASGPAPDAAAAAPITPVLDAAAEALVVPAVPDVATVAEVAAPAAAAAPSPSGLDDLPVLGAIGSFTDRVADRAGAGELLSTGTGRSVAGVAALLAAIALFLSVHRRSDRGDRKLAAAHAGPDLARFR